MPTLKLLVSYKEKDKINVNNDKIITFRDFVVNFLIKKIKVSSSLFFKESWLMNFNAAIDNIITL